VAGERKPTTWPCYGGAVPSWDARGGPRRGGGAEAPDLVADGRLASLLGLTRYRLGYQGWMWADYSIFLEGGRLEMPLVPTQKGAGLEPASERTHTFGFSCSYLRCGLSLIDDVSHTMTLSECVIQNIVVHLDNRRAVLGRVFQVLARSQENVVNYALARLPSWSLSVTLPSYP
jgi:hypothetical protein